MNTLSDCKPSSGITAVTAGVVEICAKVPRPFVALYLNIEDNDIVNAITPALFGSAAVA